VVTLITLFIPGLEDTRNIASYLADNGYSELTARFPEFHIPEIST
jgi:hypothetical protein